jgi:Nuclease-related domain
MRVVELSNHPADLLRQTRRRGAAQVSSEQRRYTADLARHDQQVRKARAARDQDRARRAWGAWLRGSWTLLRLRRQTPRPPVTAPVVPAEEARRAAGVDGERLAVAGLGQLLGDEWILLRGYHNRRGEIDLILAGPDGLAAVEVKYHNAIVRCEGDSWWETRNGRHGIRVTEQLADAGGRSPSVQLAEPARLLEEFLHRRGHPVGLQLVVWLNHPRVRLGSCVRPTVGITTTAGGVTAALGHATRPLAPEQVDQLAELIARDHAYHQGRRRT